nr:hypothetical protein [Bremia lactucae associated splipalmivirus 1]
MSQSTKGKAATPRPVIASKGGRKPAAVTPTQGLSAEFRGDSRIKDAFVVTVSGPGGTRSFTVHRPIGDTPLGDGAWVLTPTGEVTTLLSRMENPYEKRTEELRAKQRISWAVSKNLAKFDEDGTTLLLPCGKKRAELLKEAHRAAKETAKSKNTKPGAQDFLLHLSPQEKKEETALSDYLKSENVVRAAERALPVPPYETCGGPLADHKQVGVKYLDNVGTSHQAIDKLVYHLASGGDSMTPAGVMAGSPPNPKGNPLASKESPKK